MVKLVIKLTTNDISVDYWFFFLSGLLIANIIGEYGNDIKCALVTAMLGAAWEILEGPSHAKDRMAGKRVDSGQA